jgi:hypothetical protein
MPRPENSVARRTGKSLRVKRSEIWRSSHRQKEQNSCVAHASAVSPIWQHVFPGFHRENPSRSAVFSSPDGSRDWVCDIITLTLNKGSVAASGNGTSPSLYCISLGSVPWQAAVDGDVTSLHYTIKVSKDHAQVAATWDITVDMSDAELISSFTLTVEGKTLSTQCSSGNKACKGADFATLSNPTADCPVTFVITTNKPDVRKDSDVLRGQKTYDDADFSG